MYGLDFQTASFISFTYIHIFYVISRNCEGIEQLQFPNFICYTGMETFVQSMEAV